MPGQEPSTPAPHAFCKQSQGRQTPAWHAVPPWEEKASLTAGSLVQPSSLGTIKPPTSDTAGHHPLRGGELTPLHGGNMHPWVKSPAAEELAQGPSTLHPLKLGFAQNIPPSLIQEQLAVTQGITAPFGHTLQRADGGSPGHPWLPQPARMARCRSSLGVHGSQAGICTAGVRTGHSDINLLPENTARQLN